MTHALGNPELARVIFARRNVQPPTTLYVSRDDYLTITTLNSDLAQDPAFVLVRILTPLGVVQHMTYRNGVFTASSGFQRNRFPLREGQLLGVEVRAAAGGAHRGDLFAVIELTHSLGPIDQEHAILAADYVTIYQPVGWPQGSVRSTEEGPGHERLFSLASPFVGTDIQTAVPSLCRWQLKAFRATLTTSAVAGPRQVVVNLSDGVTVITLAQTHVSQTASLSYDYRGSQAQPALGPSSLNVVQIALPPGLWIRRNWTITLQRLNPQAGDQWSPSEWWVEEALSG